MDSVTGPIAEYVGQLSLGDLPDSCRAAAKIRTLDTLACAWGATDAPPVAIAKRALLRGRNHGTAHLIGGGRASCEIAAFLNGLMGRYLDFNDLGSPTGHPSNMILPLMAVADEAGKSGAELLVAIVAAYQVMEAINLEAGLRHKRTGWDVDGIMLNVGTAAGAAKLLGLDTGGIADAVAIATACGPALGVRGFDGHLAMWKGASAPQACRTAVFAALLAKEGMTGPDKPFEGRGGLWQLVTGKFDLSQYLRRDAHYLVEDTMLKIFPAENHAHGPMVAAIDMRNEIGDMNLIDSIDIKTYDWAKNGIGSAARWNVQSRETADHSYPWLLSVALLDGELTLASFEDDKLMRPEIAKLMAKITIEENSEFSKQFPEQKNSDITVHLRDGHTVYRRATLPPGHVRNPATREQLDAKFESLMSARLSRKKIASLSRNVRKMEELKSASILTKVQPD